MKYFIGFLFGFMLLGPSLSGQNWNWAQRFGGAETESIRAMSADPSGDMVVGGSYRSEVNFAVENFTALAGSDAYLMKLDNNGNVDWALTAGSLSNDNTVDVKIDSEGNILWLGQYWVEVFFENDSISSGPNSKAYFIGKFNPGGELIWLKSVNGTSTKSVNGLAIDSDDGVFLTGYFSDSLLLDDLVLEAVAVEDVFVVRLDEMGEVDWGKRYGDAGLLRSQKIDCLANGDIIIAGELTGGITFGMDTLVSVTTDYDIFVARLSGDGAEIWGRIGTGVFDNFLNAMEVGINDEIYLSGNFVGVLGIDSEEILTPGFIDNLYLIKLSADGSVLWARGLDETQFNDPSFSFDLALFEELVLMTGQFMGDLLIDELQISGGGSSKGFIASFDREDGAVDRLSKISGTEQTSGSQIEVDDLGRLHVAGVFFEDANFGSNTLESLGGTDFFIAQSNPAFTDLETLTSVPNSIRVYPNPVMSRLVFETLDAEFKVEIFDSLGRLVLAVDDESVLDVSHLSTGQYFYRYQAGNNSVADGFVKH